MKKLLALVLALVMAMSLVTISNAAFDDAADIDLTEAVEVLNAVGVLEGSDGKFNPQGDLTRSQACKIIAYLDLGKDVAEALPAVQVYSDVPADNWAAKFVTYCADAGYVSGVGDGKFDPNAKVTGYQFGKMLLCALGYDATIEQMTGASWQIAVAKLMEKNDINDGVDGFASAALTREEAAQYALNALKATTVDYDNRGTDISLGTVGTITVGATKAEAVTVKVSANTNEYALAISGEAVPASPTDMTVELGEKLYKGKLDLDSTTSTDGYGRPVNEWEYKGDFVAYSAQDAKVIFTAGLNSDSGKKTIASDLKGYKFNGTELKNKDTVAASAISIDSLSVSSGANLVDAIAALTANGKVVEFYADSDKNITDIVVITYKVAKVTSVSTNKDGDVTYTINNSVGSLIDYADDYVNEDTIEITGSIAKNDYVVCFKDVNTTGLYYVYAASKMSGQQTKTDGTTLTIGGTAYKLGKGVTGYDSYSYTNSTKAANYYLDQYGYVVASSDVEADLVYAVVNQIAAKSSTTGIDAGKSAQAELVFTDGTKKTVDVSKVNDIKVSDAAFDVNDTVALTWVSGAVTAVAMSETVSNNDSVYNGQIVSYVIDSDGKYELTFVESPTSVSATSTTLTNKGVPAFGSGTTKSATTATVYVVKTLNSSSKEVFKSYTGFANVPTVEATTGNTLTAQYVTEDSKVVFVYIDASSNSQVGEKTTDNIFYAHSATVTTTGNSTDGYVYELTGILDGVATTIQSKADDFKVVGSPAAAMAADTFYTIDINEDGYVTSATATSFSANGTADQALLDSIEDGSFGGYLTNDETKVYVIDGGDVTEGTPESIAISDTWYVILPTTGTAAEKNTIETLYIVEA